jgi:hypothetical protein
MKKIYFYYLLGVILSFFCSEVSIAQRINNKNNPSFTQNNQEILNVNLKWSENKSIFYGENLSYSYFSFNEADYDFLNNGLPLFWCTLDKTVSFEPEQIELINPVFEIVSDGNKNKGVEFIEETIKLEWNLGYARKLPILKIGFVPLVKKNGQISRLLSAQIKITYSKSKRINVIQNQRFYSQNSVLSSGNWYKIGVVQTGIYKIDYAFLKSLGIDVKLLNPLSIKLYGKGGGMLPFKNSDYRPNDLPENAIYIEGENDGKFDSTDYILFYGQGPDKWIRDNVSCIGYSLQKNIYTDTTFYFINVSSGLGKRISNMNEPAPPSNYSVTQFDDFRSYEKDQLNLIKSGREFYGEFFESITDYTFEFKFPNLITNVPIGLRASVAARCVGCSSSFTISASGSDLNKNIPVASAPSVYYGDYVMLGSICTNFKAQVNSVPLKISYNKTGDSFGYLNFIELKARRGLMIDENQMFFKDLNAVGNGNIASYTLGNFSSNYQVWNVTNPVNVSRVGGTVNGTNLIFKCQNDSIVDFVSFHTSIGLLRPFVSKKVTNQNLHAYPQADYIIVTHPLFKKQAEDLAAIHKTVDSLSVNIATTEEIYNEFSSGMPDVTAIKDFIKMFYDRATNASELPKYLLLFGDGSYDNKNFTPSNTNFIPTYQSENSTQPINSYVSEDYFGLLDDNEGDLISDVIDIGIGRFPVKNVKDANGIVNKIRMYLMPTSYLDIKESNQSCLADGSANRTGYGDWRNVICFVADDQDGGTHMAQADALSNLVDTVYKVINIDKIFSDAYKQEVSAGGQKYPDVNEAINRRLERGALIVNYTGHGGETGWSGERILDMPMIQNWSNINTLPLFVTATCEFSRFDDPARTSAGELVFLNEKGGGIGLLTTTRLVYSNPNYLLNVNFYKHVFDTLNGQMARLGDIIRLTKTSSSASVNNRNFTLLGDPAIRLACPSNQIFTSSINNSSISSFTDTVKALSKITVKGFVANNSGSKLNGFNGVLYPTVYDKKATITSLGNDGPPDATPRMNFFLQKNVVYRGKVSVTNGDFEFSFIVPKDISYNIDYGKISYYAENGKTDANGYENRFLIGGFNDKAPADNSGPEIKLFMNDEKFVSGGLTNEAPNIFAKMFDENGINTVGNGIGHDITAILDENTDKTLVLNDFYQAETNSYQKGSVRYKLNDLSEGRHTLKLKAWDVYNNSNETLIEFIVAKSENLALNHVLNYPNPFTTRTQFFFEHNKPCSYLAINIQVFSVSGRLVKTIESNMFNNSYRSEGIEWDGRDDFGDKLARGVYVYKLNVRASDGSFAEKIEKLVVLQ